MKTMPIATRTASYLYTYGAGAVNLLPEIFKSIGSNKIAIVTDSNVYAFYAAPVEKLLNDNGLKTHIYTLEAGERSKNAHKLFSLLDFLAAADFRRSDCILALGGGTVSDMASLAASLYMRGIRIITLTTTLLGALDAAIGGKNAVDFQGRKNLIGTFYQPTALLCDADFFSTLPQDSFTDGIAEAIKYGIIADREILALLGDNLYAPTDDAEELIGRCAAVKARICREDEFDTGERRKLNFGHTIGHALESVSGFTLSHGRAVALGMKAESTALCRRGLCPEDVVASINSLIKRYRLPERYSADSAEIYKAAVFDKKFTADFVALPAFTKAGDSFIYEMKNDDFCDFVRDAAEALE